MTPDLIGGLVCGVIVGVPIGMFIVNINHFLRDEVDEADGDIERAQERADGWARVSTDARIKLLALEAQVAEIRRGLEPIERVAQTEGSA